MPNAPESFGNRAIITTALLTAFTANPAHADNFSVGVQDGSMGTTARVTATNGNIQNALAMKADLGAFMRNIGVGGTTKITPMTTASLNISDARENAGRALGTTDVGNLTGQRVRVSLNHKLPAGITVGTHLGQESINSRPLANGNFRGDRATTAGFNTHLSVGDHFEITADAGKRNGTWENHTTSNLGATYYGGNTGRTTVRATNDGKLHQTQFNYAAPLDNTIALHVNASETRWGNGQRTHTVGVGLEFKLDGNNTNDFRRHGRDENLNASEIAEQENMGQSFENLAARGNRVQTAPAPLVCPVGTNPDGFGGCA